MAAHTELLQKVSLFANLAPDDLERISAHLIERKYPKDAPIVTRDEPGDAMFITTKGRVKVVIQGDGGREVILSILKAGDFFGEMALVDDQPRSASVIAHQAATVLMLKRDAFMAELARSPKMAINILAEMSQRLRRADSIISNLALLDVYSRVAHIMIDMAKRDGEEVEEGILIRQRPTQQDIASMIGTSRETVSRVLSEFQRRGFVQMRGREILLSRNFATGAVEPAAEESGAGE